MDFSKFTITKKYIRNNTQFELFFDFDLKEITGHNRKTFDDCRSLLYFLQSNLGKVIYLTTTQTTDFYEEDDKLVINLRSYQEFCKKIAQNGRNRTQAFLAQKLKHYLEDDRKTMIANSTGEEILVNLNPETRKQIEEKLRIVNTPEVVDRDKVVFVDDQNKKQILEQVINKGYSDDFWALVSSKEPELTDRLMAGRIQANRRRIIDELETRLSSGNFSETSGDDSWQKWIYKNSWLFGINYQPPIEKQKININGIMPDFLFPTLDGFVDILEIKLPSVDIIEKDVDHLGSWVWSKDANCAIGQVVNYLCEIDRLKFEIEKSIQQVYGRTISMLKPRAFILIGQNDSWDFDKKEGLRKLNHSLHGIEILTYSDLLKRGEAFIESAPDIYVN